MADVLDKYVLTDEIIASDIFRDVCQGIGDQLSGTTNETLRLHNENAAREEGVPLEDYTEFMEKTLAACEQHGFVRTPEGSKVLATPGF